MVREGRKVFLPYNLKASYKNKGCFVPSWSKTSETKVQRCQVTGMETVNSLYQLPPAQASLTHRLVTCLEWAAGEHTHEAAQRATGHSSFPVNCVQVRPCSQTRSLLFCYFFVKRVSFHFENVL